MTYGDVRILGSQSKGKWHFVSGNTNGKLKWVRNYDEAMLFTRDKAAELMMDSDEGLVIFDLYDINTTRLSST